MPEKTIVQVMVEILKAAEGMKKKAITQLKLFSEDKNHEDMAEEATEALKKLGVIKEPVKQVRVELTPKDKAVKKIVTVLNGMNEDGLKIALDATKGIAKSFPEAK